MICQISYMTPGIPPQYSVRKCAFVVILKFQINDQFSLIQFALAVQVIEWGQSMWNMCQDYYFSCFCHIFSRKQLERDAIFRQHKQGSRLSNGCVRIAQFDWLIRTTPHKHKHVANKNRSAEVQNTTQKRFNW